LSLYIYADETEFKLNEDDEKGIIGTGLLLTESPINFNVIDIALKNLKKEIGIMEEPDTRDLRTDKRGYFHASDDSKNAHSYLCESIRDNVVGNFYYSYFDSSNDDKDRSMEHLMRLTLKLASMFILNRDEIIFNYEGRGSFKIDSAKLWLEDFYNGLENHVIKDKFPTTFPKINIIEGNKSTEGIQVTDFILWAFNRKTMDSKKSEWVKRLEIDLMLSYEDDVSLQGGTYSLSKGLKLPPIRYPTLSFKPIDPKEAYRITEWFLINLAHKGLPSYATNHEQTLFKIVKSLNDINIGPEMIRNVSSLFLRLFDTIPIYKDINGTDEEKWSKILTARNCSILALKKGQIHSIRYCQAIARWRREKIIENPDFFVKNPL